MAFESTPYFSIARQIKENWRQESRKHKETYIASQIYIFCIFKHEKTFQIRQGQLKLLSKT